LRKAPHLSDMQLFDNGEFQLEVEWIDEENFTVFAPPLARQLGFRDAAKMVSTLPDDEKGYLNSGTPGGEQRIWYVTEAGLYRALGQRRLSRIRDPKVVEKVEGFQSWVFKEVIPKIRKTGGYTGRSASYVQPQPRNSMENRLEPNTFTWEEVAALIYQRTGIPLTVNDLCRNLRAGGVLKQTGAPTAKYRHLFWFTGSSWNVHSHVMPQLTYKVFDTGRELQDFRFIQARLEIEGVGQSVPAQRQPGVQAPR